MVMFIPDDTYVTKVGGQVRKNHQPQGMETALPLCGNQWCLSLQWRLQ